ncbi:MAG: hypothetical protein IPJ65_33540 [Archangiaceae bacterium]|nr:hypothetical protein [Archangiaceae bacterium]
MLALALSALLSQTVNPYTGVVWNNPLAGQLDPVVTARVWARVTKPSPGKVAPHAELVATDFKPEGPRTGAQALLAASKTLGRGQRQALVEGLNAGLDAFEREARKNNVAAAVAFLLAVALQVANEKEVSDAESAALTQGLNDELAASAGFKRLTPKQKQALYERCVVAGSLLGGMAAQAADANDAALKKQTQEMAQTVLQEFRKGSP